MSPSTLSVAIGPGPLILAPRRRASWTRLAADARAVEGMTDFDKECPVVVDAERPIEAALTEMHLLGVRSMVVIHGERVVGLITAEVIEGERPIQFLHSTDCLQDRCRHSDIRVADIMTPWDALPTLALEDIARASLGQVASAMQTARADHLAVVEPDVDSGCLLIRGLFSRARLERHLGHPLNATP